jgi:5-amino-6-(5-phospho-D-ribitylamino)uracil phosphatase
MAPPSTKQGTQAGGGDSTCRIERVGHHLLIATGRSAVTTLPVLDRIGAWPEYVVCSNGAVILQRDGAAPSGYHRLHAAGFDASAVLAAVRANLPETRIAVEDEAGVYRYTHPFQPATTEAAEEQVIVPFEALLDGRAVRVVARGAKTSSSGRPS